MICNRDKREEIDFIQIVEPATKVSELGLIGKSFMQICITLMSGSKINCVSDGILLTPR